MGVFRIPVEFANPDGTRAVTVEAFADTGATVCQLPRALAEQIGLVADNTRCFHLADGQEVRLDIAPGRVAVLGDFTRCDIAIGGESAEPILGSVALEQMALGVDPVHETLIPAKMWLLAAA